MLTAKQREFVKLYLGRNSQYHGNATASYKKAYGCTNDRVAQSSGSRLTKHYPEIRALIEKAQQKALDQLAVDAAFVLKQSTRLYDIAMGDLAVEVEVIDKVRNSKGELVHVPRTVEKRMLNLAVASKQLDQIGRHTAVQAFQDNVEHSHVHRLEQRLAAKHKEIEAKAKPRDITGECERIEDTPPLPAEEESKKRVHPAGGRNDDASAAEKTTLSAAGAPGE